MTALTIDTAERRRRLAVRHGLAPGARADDPEEAARCVLALHATDPASVFLSARVRLRDPELAAIERALYEDRHLLRFLAMRRTLFVAPIDTVPVLLAAASRAVAANERRRLVARIEAHGIAPDGGPWLDDVLDSTLRVIDARGEAVSTGISADEPRLRSKVLLNPGKKYEAEASISVWVLGLLAAEGRIVRARPRGTWISTQYRWATAARWLGAPIAELPVEAARIELVRLWLRTFGPATIADLRWWTGWPLRDVRAALAGLATADVDLDGAAGIVLADDLEPTPAVPTWIALLPSLDATVMGWQGRAWYLGPHAAALFDRNGNAGPTIWLDGRVVGGWAQRPDGEIATRLLEDVGSEASAAVAAEAARLRDWIGPTRYSARFPAPLERELRA
jgi:hypothetical protein